MKTQYKATEIKVQEETNGVMEQNSDFRNIPTHTHGGLEYDSGNFPNQQPGPGSAQQGVWDKLTTLHSTKKSTPT